MSISTHSNEPAVRSAISLPMAKADDGPIEVSRRDLLKLAGFAFASMTLAGCKRAPVQYAIPLLTETSEIVPGRDYHYATTCGGCNAGCGVLTKNRDGRPIKLEGNPDHPLSRGGLCAVGQASLLGLYDQQRLSQPLNRGIPAEWKQIDQAVSTQLETVRKQNGAVRFLTDSFIGPTMLSLIQQLLNKFPGSRHVVCDLGSTAAIAESHFRTHGVRIQPHYHLDKAKVIVSFDADFLGTWISPVEFTAAYQAGRRLEGPNPTLSYHVQFESLVSLTGSKADRRICQTPRETGSTINHLAIRLAKKAGMTIPGSELVEMINAATSELLDELADRLWQSRSQCLILCGSSNVEVQVLCNFMNYLLANYGTSVDLDRHAQRWTSNAGDMRQLLDELHQGKVAALLIHGVNPVHDLPGGEQIAADLQRVPLSVSFAPRLDETARAVQFVCPDHHFLEGWSDAAPVNGQMSLIQPVIAPLQNTRSILESLSQWIGNPKSSLELVRSHWQKDIHSRNADQRSFEEFWERTLHNGFATVKPTQINISSFNRTNVRLIPSPPTMSNATHTLVLYSKVGMPESHHAYNPWLHELPDPISKVTWDNYVCISPNSAALLGVVDGDVLSISHRDLDTERILEIPAYVLPGMSDQVIGVALGYGSVLSRRFAKIGPEWLESKPTVGLDGLVGKNAAGLMSWVQGGLSRGLEGVQVTKTGLHHALATTQNYDKVSVPKHLALPGQETRPIIRETSLREHRQELERGRAKPAAHGAVTMPDRGTANGMWPDDHHATGPQWGMAIDLSACTGCSACVVACQVENNTPVVGKDEVLRHREMHWIRIDRYFTERRDGVDAVHQPMFCQQCGNAPCEVVCPVLATVHSEEGLNEQVYNRCVGTRYCANNCPYKVRRFNWFDYAHDDLLHNLVLNPDVTVRSRGVMEKCTFCVQRIQEAKMEFGQGDPYARNRVIQTACQQSCPAQAIVFGNLNDPMSRVARLAADQRSYQVLGELNIRPAVNYLAVVRNRPADGEGKQNG